MPDTNEQHLPFYSENEVYDLFKAEGLILSPKYSTASKPYFCAVWKSYCHDIKIRKHRRFEICTVCEELQSSIRKAFHHRESTEHLLSQKRAHISFVSRESLLYRMKKEETILQPETFYHSLDGADQSAFGLPHFAV